MKNSKPTKRKFYGKWLYKITLRIPGIGFIRYRNINDSIDFIVNNNHRELYYISSSTVQKIYKHSKMILNFLNSLQTVSENDWGKRIENDNIDIYTNNKDFFDMLSKRFINETVHRFEPEGDPNLLSDGGICVVNHYPHHRYQFKVFLQPHKLNGNQKRKQDFLDWLDTQGEKIHISQSVKDWFLTNIWNWDRRYMYIDNEQTLLMLKMRESQALGRIHKYVLVDK
jgi:hypothetical protein